MSETAAHVAASGSMPVGLCGALTTMSRVRGVTEARSRSTSIAQPSLARSSWSVTSAPAARATSWRLWYAGQVTIAWSPGPRSTFAAVKIASSAPENVSTSSGASVSYSDAISARSSGCPGASV